jgi:hypothetical protein
MGISLVNTLVARHQQIHGDESVENMTPLNIHFQNLFNGTWPTNQQPYGVVVQELTPVRQLVTFCLPQS